MSVIPMLPPGGQSAQALPAAAGIGAMIGSSGGARSAGSAFAGLVAQVLGRGPVTALARPVSAEKSAGQPAEEPAKTEDTTKDTRATKDTATESAAALSAVLAPALAAQLALAAIVAQATATAQPTTPGPAGEAGASGADGADGADGAGALTGGATVAMLPTGADAEASAVPATATPTTAIAGPGVSATGVIGATTAAAGASPASADSSASAPVSHQVFPEVTRLATAGNGTHRVTLQLQPEALGEVRVVLTVRDGAVQVRLSAGNDAQRALLAGAPELHRLLELTGASDTRIVVRDLPSAAGSGGNPASTAGSQGGDGFARHTSGQPGTDGDASPGHHAGTRGGGTTATDGTEDAAAPPRLDDQVTRTRLAGVDVTV